MYLIILFIIGKLTNHNFITKKKKVFEEELTEVQLQELAGSEDESEDEDSGSE